MCLPCVKVALTYMHVQQHTAVINKTKTKYSQFSIPRIPIRYNGIIRSKAAKNKLEYFFIKNPSSHLYRRFYRPYLEVRNEYWWQ